MEIGSGLKILFTIIIFGTVKKYIPLLLLGTMKKKIIYHNYIWHYEQILYTIIIFGTKKKKLYTIIIFGTIKKYYVPLLFLAL